MITIHFNYTAARHSEASLNVTKANLAREVVLGKTILSAKHFLKKKDRAVPRIFFLRGRTPRTFMMTKFITLDGVGLRRSVVRKIDSTL